MKKTYTIAIIFLVGMTFMACQNNKPGSTERAPITTPLQPSGSVPSAPTTTTTAVEHYTCPNGHVGFGGAAQGTCSKCNTALVHNTAYHNNAATPNTAIPSNSPISPVIQNPAAGQPAPAQNASGVWHYTCSNGCAGGAGAKGTCATCGSALAHNQAYHN